MPAMGNSSISMKPAGDKHLSGLLRGVAHDDCRNCGMSTVVPNSTAPEDEVEEHGGGEIAVLEQLQLEDGVRVSPFVDDQRDQRDHRSSQTDGDVSRAEPVFLLTLVENHLQEAETDDDQRQADVVHLHRLPLKPLQPRRILDHD